MLDLLWTPNAKSKCSLLAILAVVSTIDLTAWLLLPFEGLSKGLMLCKLWYDNLRRIELLAVSHRVSQCDWCVWGLRPVPWPTLVFVLGSLSRLFLLSLDSILTWEVAGWPYIARAGWRDILWRAEYFTSRSFEVIIFKDIQVFILAHCGRYLDFLTILLKRLFSLLLLFEFDCFHRFERSDFHCISGSIRIVKPINVSVVSLMLLLGANLPLLWLIPWYSQILA